MSNDKPRKQPRNLAVGDTFVNTATRVTVTGPVSLAEMRGNCRVQRIAVPTTQGVLNIPVGTLLKMV